MSRRKAETDVKERGIEVQAARRDKGSRERERENKKGWVSPLTGTYPEDEVAEG